MQRLNDQQRDLVFKMAIKTFNAAWLSFVILALLETHRSYTPFFYLARSLLFWILAAFFFVLVTLIEFKFDHPDVQLSLSNLSLSSSREKKEKQPKPAKKKKQDRTAF
jgi:type III secretory pathway component EscU